MCKTGLGCGRCEGRRFDESHTRRAECAWAEMKEPEKSTKTKVPYDFGLRRNVTAIITSQGLTFID